MNTLFAKQNWRQLLCIQIGGAICLPVIITGQMLVKNYGYLSALGAIILGNFFLMMYAYLTSSMATKERKSTVECVITIFGTKGTHIFGFVFIISMLGWFAIQLNLMTESLIHFLTFLFPNQKINPLLINLLI